MPRNGKRGRWAWIAAVLLLLTVTSAVCLIYAMSHARPILRARVIDSLSARFRSKVELTELDVSLANGLGVEGKGLKIFGPADPNGYEPGIQPLIAVREFRFQTGLRSLFQSPMHVHSVYVKGLVLNIPPRQERRQFKAMRKLPKMSIVVDEFVCEETQLLINTTKPGKAPLDFEIGSLKMEDVGGDGPMRFDATLVNPKPVGDVQSVGKFGPFHETEPRDTPVSGDYSFTNADLGTISGIAGILSSTGRYRGTLGKIEVDGSTDTPEFRLARSGHPVDLRTDFHAIVDGTDGDTYLQPVKAHFLRTSFTARGKIVKVQNPHGHDIELDVVMENARIEDLLRLGVKTEPPVMSGPVALRTRMNLPPGPQDISDRLELSGNFEVPQGEFSNDKIQGRIDSLSLRAQGKPRLAQEHVDVNVASTIAGTFRLNRGVFTFSRLNFSVPGAHSDVHGQYSLDGNLFDFHGKLMLEAKLSQMTTGWKSFLLKPVDPFFSKHGAGTELPFKITGTRSEPHFGLDFGHHDAEAQEKMTSEPALR